MGNFGNFRHLDHQSRALGKIQFNCPAFYCTMCGIFKCLPPCRLETPLQWGLTAVADRSPVWNRAPDGEAYTALHTMRRETVQRLSRIFTKCFEYLSSSFRRLVLFSSVNRYSFPLPWLNTKASCSVLGTPWARWLRGFRTSFW